MYFNVHYVNASFFVFIFEQMFWTNCVFRAHSSIYDFRTIYFSEQSLCRASCLLGIAKIIKVYFYLPACCFLCVSVFTVYLCVWDLINLHFSLSLFLFPLSLLPVFFPSFAASHSFSTPLSSPSSSVHYSPCCVFPLHALCFFHSSFIYSLPLVLFYPLYSSPTTSLCISLIPRSFLTVIYLVASLPFFSSVTPLLPHLLVGTLTHW